MVNFECFLNDYHMMVEVTDIKQIETVFGTFDNHGKTPFKEDLLWEAEETLGDWDVCYIGLMATGSPHYYVFSNFDDDDTVISFYDVLFDKLSISPDALLDILMD